jgi:potassium-transporting ATPase potassium-binding subunit
MMGLLLGAAQTLSITLISLVLAIPIGEYLALVFAGKRTPFDRLFDPIEAALSKLLMGVDRDRMNWKEYAIALLALNAILWGAAFVMLYAAGMSPDLAFHTAMSFVTNTDQQHYSGDTFSPLAQMAVFTTLMFASAATGISSAFALIRGLVATDGKIGNFFSDFIRCTIRVLLPGAILVAVVFVACGIPQTLGGTLDVRTLTGIAQSIPLGPVASLESIKYIGTNGGGYYGANSAHPFENPSPLTNVIQNVLALLIPFSIPYAFGVMVGKRRQGVIVLVAMLLIFMIGSAMMVAGEESNPMVHINSPDGYLEGKEQRFTAYETVFFLAVDTYVQSGGTSGSVTSMMPSAILGAMSGMMMQCTPGGVGAGFDVMLVYILLSVFIAGLMVGRTPEFLGKKIEPNEMKLVALVIIIHPIMVLLPTALTILLNPHAALNPGARGFSEIMYEFLSASANNGSGMAGLANTTPYFNVLSGLVIAVGRYVPLVAMIAIAGLLSRKKPIEATTGTLPTDNTTFLLFLIGIIVIVGAITFLPILTFGPLAELLAEV